MTMTVAGVSGAQLLQYVERIERLAEEMAALKEDSKEVYAEAKAAGFDTGIMRQVVKLRAMSPDEVAENEELLDLYMQAIGMKGAEE